MFTSTLNLIPITSRLAKVSGSRKLKPTLLSANHTKTPKKPFGKEGLFCFQGWYKVTSSARELASFFTARIKPKSRGAIGKVKLES